ncbi:MAG: SMEK domain-containing protein [Pyrinomonadaceae bacterium]
MNQQKSLQRISEILAIFVKQIESENAMGLFDKNRITEDIFIPVFSEVYDYKNLVNLNLLGENYAGLDLGDDKARVAFQISSNVTNQKVKETLQSIIDNKYYEKYDTFIIYDITEKQRSYSGSGWSKIIDKRFIFTSDNILDYKDLSSSIRHLEFSKIEKIEKILEDQFSFEFQIKSHSWQRYAESLSKIMEQNAFYLFRDSIPIVTTDIFLREANTKSQDAKNKKQPSEIPSFRLEEILKKTPRFFIVGPSGYGKTTALRRLTLELTRHILENHSDSPTNLLKIYPVYVRLSEFTNSLLNLIAQSMREKDFDVSEDTLLRLLKRGELTLLLDGFDEISNKRKFCEDLKDLYAMAPDTKFIISTRYVPALPTLSELFTRYDVLPLEDNEILEILSGFLGTIESENLFLNLVDKGLIDEFRSPLMIGFIAILYKEESSFFDKTKAELYQAIVNKWFTDWEARRKPSQVDYEFSSKINSLAHLGYQMLLQNDSTIVKEKALNILAQEINEQDRSPDFSRSQELLDYFLGMQILDLHSNQVSFAHLSFRDFFAASWMETRFSLQRVMRFSFNYNKHESIIFLLGLLDSTEARRILIWHLRFIRLSLTVANLDPNKWATNHIFLVLRGLLATKESHNDLKDQFVRQLPQSKIPYLAYVSVPLGIIFSPFDPEYIHYKHFCALIGQLKTPNSANYLQNSITDRELRVAGLSRVQDSLILLTELTKFDEDFKVDFLIVGVVLRNPPHLSLAAIKQFIKEADSKMKSRVLILINHLLREKKADVYFKLYERNKDWFEFLVDVYFNEEDEEVSENALSIIQNFKTYMLYFTSIAEDQAINGANPNIRKRATWSFIYSKDSSKEILFKTINDEEWLVIFKGLSAIRILFPEEFSSQVIKVLERFFGTSNAEIQQTVRELIPEIPKDTGVKDYEQLGQLFIILNGAFYKELSTFRYYSIVALSRLQFIDPIYLTKVLNLIALNDSEPWIRETAFKELFFVSKEDFEKWVYQALDDPSPTVRKSSLSFFRGLRGEAAKKVIPSLQRLTTDDPDLAVQEEAGRIIRRLEYSLMEDMKSDSEFN